MAYPYDPEGEPYPQYPQPGLPSAGYQSPYGAPPPAGHPPVYGAPQYVVVPAGYNTPVYYPAGQIGRPATGSRSNGLDVAALVVSIVSIPAFIIPFGFFLSLIGVGFGIFALRKFNRTGRGIRGLAIAGIAVGAVPAAVSIVVFSIEIIAHMHVL